MHISENILFLRESENLSQAEFGKRFGLNRGNISSYESGTVPPIGTLLKIANHFNIDIEDLVNKKLNDAFSQESNARHSSNKNDVYAGSSSKKTSLAKEPKSDYKHLEERIKALEEIIRAKDETILKLNKLTEALEKTIELLEKKR